MNFAQIFEKYQITHLLEFRKVINKGKKWLGFHLSSFIPSKSYLLPPKKLFQFGMMDDWKFF